MAVPRMRTAQGVMNIIKEQDPRTEVTLHLIRSLIRSTHIPVVHVGRKKLVDADALLELIQSGIPDVDLAPAIGHIRKV